MKKLKIAVICLVATSLVMSLGGCGNRHKTEEETVVTSIEWPTTGLAVMLPKPSTEYGEVFSNSEDSFIAELTQTTSEDYFEYVDACKEYGYTVEADESQASYPYYNAYNEDGYFLSLSYYEDDETYDIALDGPIIEPGSTFEWPTVGPALLIPQPSSNVGEIQKDSSDKFSVNVGEFSTEDFNNYIEECIAAGFNVDYNRTDTKYKALDENGNELTVEYKGCNVVFISIEALEEEQEDATDQDTEEAGEDASEEVEEEQEKTDDEAEPEEEEQPNTDNADENAEAEPANNSGQDSSDEINPDLKKTLDDYEAFIDRYVSFMETYNNSSDVTSMLSDYLDYMQQYTELAEEIRALEDTDMNAAELKYYTEVTARCSKKLLETIGSY